MPMVASRLVYCDVLCVGLPLKATWKLQLDQNATAGMLSGDNRFQHVTPILQEIHWLPIIFWGPFKVLVFTSEGLYCGPRYPDGRFTLQTSTPPSQSSGKGLLWIPPVTEVWLMVTRGDGLLCGVTPAPEFSPCVGQPVSNTNVF